MDFTSIAAIIVALGTAAHGVISHRKMAKQEYVETVEKHHELLKDRVEQLEKDLQGCRDELHDRKCELANCHTERLDLMQRLLKRKRDDDSEG